MEHVNKHLITRGLSPNLWRCRCRLCLPQQWLYLYLTFKQCLAKCCVILLLCRRRTSPQTMTFSLEQTPMTIWGMPMSLDLVMMHTTANSTPANNGKQQCHTIVIQPRTNSQQPFVSSTISRTAIGMGRSVYHLYCSHWLCLIRQHVPNTSSGIL